MSNSTISTMTPASDAPIAAALSAILQADPVSCEILRFFLANERAMDSAKGIAGWWVHRDELAVQPSLNRLFACGAVLAHTLTSGVTLYRLTPDPDVRGWLRDALGVSDDHSADKGGPVKQEKTAAGASII